MTSHPPQRFGPRVNLPESKTHHHPVIGGEDHPERDKPRRKKEAPMGATATHRQTTILLSLFQAPDTKDEKGRPFVPDRVTVHIYPDGTWVSVEGRVIRKDGSVGVAKRHRTGDVIRNHRRWPWRPIPAWLLGLLVNVDETAWLTPEYRQNAPKSAQKVID